MQEIDLLIEAGWVVPVEPHAQVFEQHAVAVDGGRILELLPVSEAREKYAARERVQRPQAALLPGLVNVHVHNPMTLMRGLADDLPLMRWLNEHIWPAEAAVMGREFVSCGVELAVVEMLRGGTTACNENYFFPDAAAATYRRMGFRAQVGLPVIDFPTAWAASDDEYFDKALELHDALRGESLIGTAFVPHAPYTVKDASFERIKLLADQLGLIVHCHVHETAQEVEDSLKQYGQRPLARLQRLGLVNAQLLAIHMTQLTPAEIELCAAQGVSIGHCPESNLKLASGFCPIEALRRAGANIALGTDGCASNNDLDMFGEMRTAALLAKGVAMDAAALDAASALRIATLGSAKAMGLEERIGSIEPGKAADLILVDLSAPESQPFYSVISQLVYAGARSQVSDVWIEGRRRLADRQVIDVDLPALMARVGEWRARIAAAGA
jgi:5-methylthioadenosine/S-adenosylhomocysteine deaminase